MTFDVSRNQDLAAVDVQNAEKLAEPQLPDAVRTNGITIIKANTDILGVVALQSSDPRYDATYLANYLKLFVVDEIKRMPGVGDATPFPARDFSMLLQLDPEKMAQLGLTVSDVAAAVREQNATNPAGRLGAEPSPPGTQLTLPITTIGRLQTPAEFDDIVVRARARRVDRSPARHRPHGARRTQLRPRGPAQRRADGVRAAVHASRRERARGEGRGHEAAVLKCRRASPPAFAGRSRSTRRRSSARRSTKWSITLIEAMVLVTLVVFLFLQSWRATIIPMLAVPVSVIGTFLGFLALGMSINVLTLFGLVLAIGIVVDDAIVVIENVERIMASEGLSPRLAADKAIRQVGSALVAIVLVLCAVFVPVAFIGGVTGELFKQFAITIIIAVVLSGVVALTLTPALCALLLTESNETHTTGFFGWFNRVFARATRALHARGRLGHRATADRGSPCSWSSSRSPACSGGRFRPRSFRRKTRATWRSRFNCPTPRRSSARSPPSRRSNRSFASEPAVREHRGARRARLSERRREHDQRRDDLPQREAVGRARAARRARLDRGRINRKLFGLPDATAFGFNLPEVPGLGMTAGVEINFQNRNGQDIREFAQHVRGVPPGGEQAAGGGSDQHHVPRERAAGLRHGRSHRGQSARRQPQRPVRHAAGVPVDALHQRLQPVRQDIPRAGTRRRRSSDSRRATSESCMSAERTGRWCPSPRSRRRASAARRRSCRASTDSFRRSSPDRRSRDTAPANCCSRWTI